MKQYIFIGIFIALLELIVGFSSLNSENIIGESSSIYTKIGDNSENDSKDNDKDDDSRNLNTKPRGNQQPYGIKGKK
ncbi:MAG: hypothetical protein Q4G27_02150 [Flavobacteriaceae bacterium]|nr:hypothetical protein [Flavobacteriaceae bacterium]